MPGPWSTYPLNLWINELKYQGDGQALRVIKVILQHVLLLHSIHQLVRLKLLSYCVAFNILSVRSCVVITGEGILTSVRYVLLQQLLSTVLNFSGCDSR